ncbi:HET-domain-containing protein [Microthyrium microscopicum]|uniref:HET-domain-containing protein n=1 Tax=Microthyrium microscopicum TaxID=703497 RepID=A0A6A6UCM7_9PEZI|nr:HET-domain-containing protein [Microthyrium microscopicum]
MEVWPACELNLKLEMREIETRPIRLSANLLVEGFLISNAQQEAMVRPLCRYCMKLPLEPQLQCMINGTYSGDRSWAYGTFGDLRQRDCPFYKWVDFRDVSRWLRTCEAEHISSECMPPREHSTRRPHIQDIAFRFIDVEAMCIVEVNPMDVPRLAYLALSYVWGSHNSSRLLLEKSNAGQLMTPGALATCRGFIPPTVQDAMSVVHQLGERYLWVDSLCLVQDDEDELQRCCENMDYYYERSILTIVAATGDAYSGLPGVFPTPRDHKRLTREVAPGLHLTTIVDMQTLLRRSAYSKRAWTMQEEILSNRMLVFINNQVYFKCQRNLYSEAMNAPDHQLVGFNHSASLYEVLMRGHVEFTDFSTLIMYYGYRQFSYESDALRAAQGMLNKFHLLSGVGTFQGLPLPLSRSMLFEAADFAPAIVNPRREGLPSYSWAGWKYVADYSGVEHEEPVRDYGQSALDSTLRHWITYQYRLIDQDISTVVDINDDGTHAASSPISVEESRAQGPQEFRDINIATYELDMGNLSLNSSPYPLLHFNTVILNLNLERIIQQSSRTTYLCARDRTGLDCGRLGTDMKLDPVPEIGTFALIAAKDNDFMALLLVCNENGIAERRGIVELRKEVLETCLDPGPRWRKVVLR